MAVVQQQTSAQWHILPIPGEAEQEPTTVMVCAAKIQPKLANSLIRELGSKAPLPLLNHVKRIQRSTKEGVLELTIILCTIDSFTLGEKIDLPDAVSKIVEKYSLQPFMTSVAEHPARDREEWETQCRLWPTSFHPNSGKTAASSELNQADADMMLYFMQKAIGQARLARQHGQYANGAVIVDPALGAVIATGYDCSTPSTSNTSSSGSGPPSCSTELEDKNVAEVPLRSHEWHPLKHAVMEAIRAVAERDKSLWPDKGAWEEDKGRGQRGSSDGVVNHNKRHRSPQEDINGSDTAVYADRERSLHSPETSLLDISRPYLCTAWDLYVTREPCTMCAMAMVHQRIRRVIYGIPNSAVGALGSRYKLHGLPSLNHHYSVFQVSLNESDLL